MDRPLSVYCPQRHEGGSQDGSEGDGASGGGMWCLPHPSRVITPSDRDPRRYRPSSLKYTFGSGVTASDCCHQRQLFVLMAALNGAAVGGWGAGGGGWGLGGVGVSPSVGD